MDIEIRDIHQKYFDESTPQNFKGATAEIGSGTNGKVTITAPDVSTDVVVNIGIAEAKSTALSVEFALGAMINITLATTADDVVTADDTKNTATLIAKAINALNCGYTAVASGTGATAISTATEDPVVFTDGQYGTPCSQIGLGFVSSATYYVNTKADNTKYNNGWRTFSLANY